MVSISREFIYEITKKFVTYSLIDGIIGGTLIGYTYAKLSDLPTSELTKAFAVWYAVQSVFLILADIFIEDKKFRQGAHTAILMSSLMLGVNQLIKRGWMTRSMKIVVAVVTISLIAKLHLIDS